MIKRFTRGFFVVSAAALWAMPDVRAVEPPTAAGQATVDDTQLRRAPERPDDPYLPPGPRVVSRPAVNTFRGVPNSVQVNVDPNGFNIVGDAANEPSLAIDPTRPNRIVIGWRQFDTIASNFRQAGYAYSRDSGRTWTFPGTLDPGNFRSDPVLDSDAAGNIYYMNIFVPLDFSFFRCDMFISGDGGVTWDGPHSAFGGDKEWFVVDKTGSVGGGHLYQAWSTAGNNYFPNQFNLSSNGGTTWTNPIELPQPRPIWGTLAVDNAGTLYVCGQDGGSFYVIKSTTAKFAPFQATSWNSIVPVDLDGPIVNGAPPNPGGLAGQTWVATDKSGGATDGNVYLLCSVNPPGGDPLDVMFSRSEDGGQTWSAPVRVNDDVGNNYQWFGTMSVAPNGRIDVIFNDTRGSGVSNISELYYASSSDAGVTWSTNVALSGSFNSLLGHPNQNKIGDYYDMISDDVGASLAWAATFNGEQDVYFLRIGDYDCNGNGVGDSNDISLATSSDVNGDGIPDECQCLGDTNGDLQVNISDLGALLAAFGTCSGDAGYDASADIDNSGCINITDLGLLLAAFGQPCP